MQTRRQALKVSQNGPETATVLVPIRVCMSLISPRQNKEEEEEEAEGRGRRKRRKRRLVL